jgi:hypothetical protein
MSIDSIPFLEKEDITNIEFSPYKKSTKEKKILKKKLEGAVINGNMSKIKYKIIFNTTEGLRLTRTTLWFVGTNYVLLKSNTFIPIESIKDII